jgi:hypothetical protein
MNDASQALRKTRAIQPKIRTWKEIINIKLETNLVKIKTKKYKE